MAVHQNYTCLHMMKLQCHVNTCTKHLFIMHNHVIHKSADNINNHHIMLADWPAKSITKCKNQIYGLWGVGEDGVVGGDIATSELHCSSSSL